MKPLAPPAKQTRCVARPAISIAQTQLGYGIYRPPSVTKWRLDETRLPGAAILEPRR